MPETKIRRTGKGLMFCEYLNSSARLVSLNANHKRTMAKIAARTCFRRFLPGEFLATGSCINLCLALLV